MSFPFGGGVSESAGWARKLPSSVIVGLAVLGKLWEQRASRDKGFCSLVGKQIPFSSFL